MERLSDLNDGRHEVWAYCAGKGGLPPCPHRAKLDLGALIERWGDIEVRELRQRLRCRCGAGATITVSHSGRPSR